MNFLTRYNDGTIASSARLQAQFQQMSVDKQKTFQSKAIDIYKADMQFALDQLMQLNEDQSAIFYHRLDLNAIGVMGHSAGGTAAIELC
jgi:predicted dienelactone hydrolase